MADPHSSAVEGIVVEEQIRLTLDDLSRACHVARTEVIILVEAGVLEPAGTGPENWFFAGPALRRARVALRLARDLELGVTGTAVALELLDEIEALRSRLRRAGLL
ncbi:Chaperone modulatory protein CbpM [Burkholderiales bacterium]|nr:Chaperone modulatory protein CbpM [Burkholderiales bacterium]